MMMTIRTSITHVSTCCRMFIFLSVHLIEISRKRRTVCTFHSTAVRKTVGKKWNYRRWTREGEIDTMMSVVVKYLEACCCRRTLLIILSRSTTATWSSNTSIDPFSLALPVCLHTSSLRSDETLSLSFSSSFFYIQSHFCAGESVTMPFHFSNRLVAELRREIISLLSLVKQFSLRHEFQLDMHLSFIKPIGVTQETEENEIVAQGILTEARDICSIPVIY